MCDDMEVKVVSVTRTIHVERLQACDCAVLPYLNALECSLCMEPVGPARPLGIAWGCVGAETVSRGIRLCASCYALARGEAHV